MSPPGRTALPPLGILLLGLISLFWGLNWVVMKIALVDLPRWTFRALCLAGAAAGLFALARARGSAMLPPAGQWVRLAGSSVFNVTGWNLFTIYGVSLLPSGRAAILAYTMPLWGVLFGTWFAREAFTRRRAVGVALGMAGMLILIGTELSTVQAAPVGAMCIIAAAMCWALGTALIKRYPVDLPTASFTAWQLLLGGVPVFIGSAIIGFRPPGPVGTAAILAVLYNIFVCMIFCYWAWFKVVSMVPAGVAGLGTLLVPVVGVASGMLILGERPHAQEYVALVLVLGALATVVLPPRGHSR